MANDLAVGMAEPRSKLFASFSTRNRKEFQLALTQCNNCFRWPCISERRQFSSCPATSSQIFFTEGAAILARHFLRSDWKSSVRLIP